MLCWARLCCTALGYAGSQCCLYCAALRYAMLCYAMLRCFMLHYAVLHCATLCCAVLCYAALHCALICCVALCMLSYAALYCTMLCCAALRFASAVQRYVVLRYAALCCAMLYCAVLHIVLLCCTIASWCTVLCCTAPCCAATLRCYVALCCPAMVNQLRFIVPVLTHGNFARLLNYYIIRKSLACGSWFTNSSRALPTFRVVYQAINHRNLWSIA